MRRPRSLNRTSPKPSRCWSRIGIDEERGGGAGGETRELYLYMYTTKETETEAVPEEPARQRTYEEIMWDRGAAEREAVAAAKRAEEEAAAAAKKQQEEEDAMMEALLANAAKAENDTYKQ